MLHSAAPAGQAVDSSETRGHTGPTAEPSGISMALGYFVARLHCAWCNLKENKNITFHVKHCIYCLLLFLKVV